MSRRFSLLEAQSLISTVDPLLRKAIELKSEYEEAERAMDSVAQRIALLGGVLLERKPAVQARDRQRQAGEALQQAVERVQDYGCVIKDLDMGLLDFPTLFRGREVYLCWKLGEPAIAYWHGVDEGFAGRKAIDQDFRDHHRGDRAQ
jgi:hypothetical protein